MHALPVGHAEPHEPQFWSLRCRSTQAPLHSVRPACPLQPSMQLPELHV
jgi:hypothetical protein